MTRQIVNLKQAQSTLECIHSDLVESIQNAFGDWLKIREFSNSLGGGVLNYKARTKAGIIHDNIEKYIRSTLDTKEGCIVGSFGGVFGIILKNELFIRFKKMDDSYSTKNFKTKQHTKYMHQGQIKGFPDIPTFLFAGYIPDKTWMTIKGVYVACWVGNTLEWVDEFGKYTTEQTQIDFDSNEKDVFKVIEQRIKIKAENKETSQEASRVRVKGEHKLAAGKTGTDNKE
jgi:hypothetical protein